MHSDEKPAPPPRTEDMPCCVFAPGTLGGEAALTTEATPRLLAAWVTLWSTEVLAPEPSLPAGNVVARDTGPPLSGTRLHLALSVLLI